MTVRPVTTKADLLEVANGDMFLRLDVADDLGGTAHALGAAVAVTRISSERLSGLLALGPRDDLDALLAHLVATGSPAVTDLARVTTGADTLDVVGRHLPLGAGNEWEWMWTSTVPPVVPGEERLVALDETDAPEVVVFLAEHNGRTHAQPFVRPDQHWVGARDDAHRLVAVACSEPNPVGIPHLSGVTVHPDARGTGLGTAMTAHLTRAAVAETGWCTLGMFSDNVVARHIYVGLGYHDDHWLSSRRVTPARQ